MIFATDDEIIVRITCVNCVVKVKCACAVEKASARNRHFLVS